MEFILVILLTMGSSGEKPKTIKMCIPQENQAECLKSAKTFKFSLSIPLLTVCSDTRYEPRMENEKPAIREVKT